MDVAEPEAWVVMVVLVAGEDCCDDKGGDNMPFDDRGDGRIHDDDRDDDRHGDNGRNHAHREMDAGEEVTADEAAAGQAHISRIIRTGK
jgi:hypothetical protein